MGLCRSCGHIICRDNRWYCFVIARGFPENINIKQCTGYKEVEHAECAYHLHGGVITGGVIVLILLLTFLHYINKAFDEDKKEPWRLE